MRLHHTHAWIRSADLVIRPTLDVKLTTHGRPSARTARSDDRRNGQHLLNSELTFTLAICCRPSICHLSVTFVRLTQPVEIFGMFLCHLVPWPSVDIHGKFYGDRPRGTPPSGALNARGVAKYSDFGPVKGHISECAKERSVSGGTTISRPMRRHQQTSMQVRAGTSLLIDDDD